MAIILNQNSNKRILQVLRYSFYFHEKDYLCLFSHLNKQLPIAALLGHSFYLSNFWILVPLLSTRRI
jgi:hypothetical protein